MAFDATPIIENPVAAQDRETYALVKAALTTGQPVVRDFATGRVVPPNLSGKGYSARDLHSAAFAEIDAGTFKGWRNKGVR